MTRVKICGITRAQDAELAIELGASALGFNFYPQSPRYITPEAAGEIIRRVPPPVMTVGIFADEPDVEHVLAVAGEAGVSAIQLHGAGVKPSALPTCSVFSAGGEDFTAEITETTEKASVASLVSVVKSSFGCGSGRAGKHYPLIRAVTVDADFEPASLRNIEANAVLLDAPHPTLKGGTGITIDWTKAREATRYARAILAGGLTPENVAEAIRQVRPFAVDVASGVESAPGVKDALRLRAFFAAVHEADEDIS